MNALEYLAKLDEEIDVAIELNSKTLKNMQKNKQYIKRAAAIMRLLDMGDNHVPSGNRKELMETLEKCEQEVTDLRIKDAINAYRQGLE